MGSGAAVWGTNTLSQSAGGDLSRGDPLNHPRYRDFAMIPEAEFFQ